MVGHLHFSMHLKGCVDAQSYMTVVSDLFSSTFPSFLEFRAPCLRYLSVAEFAHLGL